jgi:hypothetical protein
MRGVLGLLVLAGCPGKPPPEPSVVVVHEPTPVASPLTGALDGVGMTLLLPLERQQEEIAALTDALGHADLASDRIQLALLLTLADPPLRDAARARQLLAGHTWDDAGYETLSRLAQGLIDERAARAADADDAAAALDHERRLRRALEERIEAMKAIDTEIDARELEATDDGPSEDPVR